LIPRWALGRSFQEELKKVLEDPEKRKDLYGDIKHALNWRDVCKNLVFAIATVYSHF